jgi:hypothetical protein
MIVLLSGHFFLKKITHILQKRLDTISEYQSGPMMKYVSKVVEYRKSISKISMLQSRPVVPGCGRSVNPISTRGDRLCPPNYYWHTRIFRPSDGPAVLCISVGPRPHGLETRVIIKISTHPCYPRTFDCFSWD